MTAAERKAVEDAAMAMFVEWVLANPGMARTFPSVAREVQAAYLATTRAERSQAQALSIPSLSTIDTQAQALTSVNEVVA